MPRRRRSLPLDPVMIVMTDVLFQIVVFALLCANGGAGAAALDGDVELPPGGKATTTRSARAPQITLTINAQKEILIDGTARDEEELRRLVAEACAGSDESYVLIRCDGRVDLKSLMSLQILLRDQLHVKKVEFAVARTGGTES